ncbi:helix-turn-helix domain-containing protein [Flavobacteriaceae bacterium F89]|uniref:Helix-turn-helix domain-containing protein n=1 Tax=Cerina litoralis TaxID=2874477 RepID=A0AAE3EVD7_9FLAO|nr:helix-turn-helix domain-containing protein [Cerina litoralis]MCG2460391.1 helix-turn-helix domain-containing protein [Cerina litoralis]
MSSNIEIKRICQFCEQEFIARTTVTKYCSLKCSSRAYKARTRNIKIEKSNKETHRTQNEHIEKIKAKEFLTVRDVSNLLGCSIRTVYRLIENGTIKAVNLAERLTRIKRSELNKVMEQPRNEPKKKADPIPFHIKDGYTLTEIEDKFGISESGLKYLIKKNNIPKVKNGRYAYVPKKVIDELLT